MKTFKIAKQLQFYHVSIGKFIFGRKETAEAEPYESLLDVCCFWKYFNHMQWFKATRKCRRGEKSSNNMFFWKCKRKSQFRFFSLLVIIITINMIFACVSLAVMVVMAVLVSATHSLPFIRSVYIFKGFTCIQIWKVKSSNLLFSFLVCMLKRM